MAKVKNSMIDRLSKNKLIKESILEKDDDFVQQFINTGALSLNILFSGRLNGGIPVGKISQISAPSSLGKSFVGMKVAKNAQRIDNEWIVIYVDTEMAFDHIFAESVGVDLDRLLVIQSNEIEEVQRKIMAVSNEFTKDERKKVLLIVDSWGGLVTSKTISNAEVGNDAVDFTPAKKKNTLARLMTGMGMTVFVINQIYECMIGETKVKTKFGHTEIKDLKVGDFVLTTDGMQEISETVKYENAVVYEIELEDGTIIECTGAHKFIVQGALGDMDETRWMTVENLEPGMELVENGNLLKDPVNGKY